MVHLLILVFASSCVTLSSCAEVEYHLVTVATTWTEARAHCRDTYSDLATVASLADMKRMVAMAAASGERRELWTSLKETGPASWFWSSGGPVTKTYWADAESPTKDCGVFRGDGLWYRESCSASLPFVCQDDTKSPALELIGQAMTWRKAQDYCRARNGDLATVKNQKEKLKITDMTGASPVWIGLFRDKWKWTNQVENSYRYWYSSQPNNDGDCGVYNPSYKTMFDRDCARKLPFYCSGKRKIKRRLVRVRVTVRSHLDLNDLALSRDILKQLHAKSGGGSLRWTVQPDGNIFQMTEEKTKKETC